MENLLKIITQPDNIAILMMLIAVAVCTLSAVREMVKNDRLLKQGKKDEVYRRMTE